MRIRPDTPVGMTSFGLTVAFLGVILDRMSAYHKSGDPSVKCIFYCGWESVHFNYCQEVLGYNHMDVNYQDDSMKALGIWWIVCNSLAMFSTLLGYAGCCLQSYAPLSFFSVFSQLN